MEKYRILKSKGKYYVQVERHYDFFDYSIFYRLFMPIYWFFDRTIFNRTHWVALIIYDTLDEAKDKINVLRAPVEPDEIIEV